jgi:hypothetical protein
MKSPSHLHRPSLVIGGRRGGWEAAGRQATSQGVSCVDRRKTDLPRAEERPERDPHQIVGFAGLPDSQVQPPSSTWSLEPQLLHCALAAASPSGCARGTKRSAPSRPRS